MEKIRITAGFNVKKREGACMVFPTYPSRGHAFRFNYSLGELDEYVTIYCNLDLVGIRHDKKAALDRAHELASAKARKLTLELSSKYKRDYSVSDETVRGKDSQLETTTEQPIPVGGGLRTRC